MPDIDVPAFMAEEPLLDEPCDVEAHSPLPIIAAIVKIVRRMAI
jgi:hypothetical protein